MAQAPGPACTSKESNALSPTDTPKMARETQLYLPVKEFLLRLGYTVRGEVDGCDLVARRGSDLIVVELKRSVNLTLILQGIDRQRLTDHVYLAVAAPRHSRQKRWREVVRLCRLLGLGLLTVTPGGRVEVICEPAPYRPRKAAARRRRLLAEFDGRSGDYNTGGSAQRPLVTAYREEALRVAAYLAAHGPSPVRAVREALGSPKAASILQRNVYGWFRRLARGVYELTPAGREALAAYAPVIDPPRP